MVPTKRQMKQIMNDFIVPLTASECIECYICMEGFWFILSMGPCKEHRYSKEDRQDLENERKVTSSEALNENER